MSGLTGILKVLLTRGAIIVDKEVCTGCRRCELMCSGFKEGKINPELSRIQVSGTEIYKGPDFTPQICMQCADPPCMKACPTEAIKADVEHGTYARIVDEKKCNGCEDQTSVRCMEACRQYFNPSRIRMNLERVKAINCDLCYGDPQCVKHCLFGALTYQKNERGIRAGVGGGF